MHRMEKPVGVGVGAMRLPGLPFYTATVAAGFPSPADDYYEADLDLRDLLVRHPAATYFVRAKGDSMLGAGIFAGSILVVDRSVKPVHGRIIIAAVNREPTVKRLEVTPQGQYVLHPENAAYEPIFIRQGMEFEVWGVVTAIVTLV